MNTLFRLCWALRGIILISICAAGCSMPSLESQPCNEASLAAKQFYSFHFGNDMSPSQENYQARQRFMTPELFSSLAATAKTTHDYFTNSETPPKTFKIGACSAPDPDHASVQVQIYWLEEHGSTKDTTQRSLDVEMVKQGGNWLINNVNERPAR